MKTIRTISLYVTMLAASLMTLSCNKNESPSPDPTPGSKVDICITGNFNTFSTKAEIENIFMMKWSNGDTVYVYGTTDGTAMTNLGSLTAAVVSGTDNCVADLSGSITAPQANTKLTLVYSPVLTEAPEVSGGAISIDLKNQGGKEDSVAFVAYTAVDYQGASSTYRVSFGFATSVLRVNVSELTANTALTEATLGQIETACKLTFKSDTLPTVTGASADTITRTLSGCSANAKGCAAFYVAIPIITANDYRALTVTQQGGEEYDAIGFATGAKGAGKMMNSIAPMVTTGQYGVLNGQEYVLIKAKYDGTHYSYLKWATQNLAVTASGKAKWNNTDYVIGDYFQWAAYDGYVSGTKPTNLVIYDSFTTTYTGGASNAFTFKTGKTFAAASAPYYNSSSSAYTKYTSSDSKTTLDLTDDVARIVLGGTWKMPTGGSNGQFKAMKDATKWTWDATDKGYYVTKSGESLASDKSNALLFFPATGIGNSTALYDAGNSGSYWSSTLDSDDAGYAYRLVFSSSDVIPEKSRYRYLGNPVRPVSE